MDAEDGHPRTGMAELERQGFTPEFVRAVASHADFLGVPRETPMEKALYAVDELSGFLMACAYVRPQGIHGLAPKSVKKKMKTPAFAAAIDRDEMRAGAEDLGVDFDEHVDDRDRRARGPLGRARARRRRSRVILYEHPSSGNCLKCPRDARPGRRGLRARRARPVRRRDPHARALRPQPRRPHPGARARFGRVPRRVRRDPALPRRGHRVPARRPAPAGAGPRLDVLRAEPGRGEHRRRALPGPERPGRTASRRSSPTGSAAAATPSPRSSAASATATSWSGTPTPSPTSRSTATSTSRTTPACPSRSTSTSPRGSSGSRRCRASRSRWLPCRHTRATARSEPACLARLLVPVPAEAEEPVVAAPAGDLLPEPRGLVVRGPEVDPGPHPRVDDVLDRPARAGCSRGSRHSGSWSRTPHDPSRGTPGAWRRTHSPRSRGRRGGRGRAGSRSAAPRDPRPRCRGCRPSPPAGSPGTGARTGSAACRSTPRSARPPRSGMRARRSGRCWRSTGARGSRCPAGAPTTSRRRSTCPRTSRPSSAHRSSCRSRAGRSP